MIFNRTWAKTGAAKWRHLGQHWSRASQWEELEMCKLLSALTDAASRSWWEILSSRLGAQSPAPLTIRERAGMTTAVSLRERVLKNRWSSLIGLKKIKIKQQKGKKKQSNKHSQGSLILLAKELAGIHLKYFQNPPSDLRKGRCDFHFENPNFERQQINSPPLCPILRFKCSN